MGDLEDAPGSWLHLLCCQSSSLLLHLGTQWKVTQVLGPIPPMWETWREFLVPAVSLAQSQMSQSFVE